MTVEEKNRVEGRSRKKPKVDLGIAIDFGGSMTKIMAGLPNGQWCGVTMEPEVVEISLATVAAFERKSLGQGRAKDRAWVKVGEKVYAVGYLAREFLGDAGLWRPKVELAIYKLLAALWFLKEYWHLKDKLTVSIACLLPPGEYEERDLLEQKVREVLSSYETPTGTLKIRCSSFTCRPEGFGVLASYQLLKGMAYIQQKVVAIVMLGYRNTSLMVCRRGRVSQFVSSDLGFIQMVRKVMANVAGQEETTLASAIAEAGVKISPTPLEKVLRHSSSDARKQELDKLIAAIELSGQDYRILIENWLHKSLPDGVDEILFCGGTADYLGEQGWHFQQSYPLYWHGRLQLPTNLESMGVGYRMLDVWGLWQWHQERTFDGVQSA